MTPEELASVAIRLSDLIEAFEFVSSGDLFEHSAYICRKTGEIVFISEGLEIEEGDLPSDLSDPVQYQEVPHRRDFDLGRRLALSFVAEEIPECIHDARDIFSRKGAYARFKYLLTANGVLDKWYAFEQAAIDAALREWADEVGIKLIS